jgi:gluconolactonase
VRSEQISPNGVGLSPDQKTVYWSDSMLQKLWALDLDGPGQAGAELGHLVGRPVVTLPGMAWFDSMAIEADGRVCVGVLFDGGVAVVDPSSGGYEHVPFPDPITTNICFGGADMRDAWVTCSSTGKLYKCRWPRAGLRLAFNG